MGCDFYEIISIVATWKREDGYEDYVGKEYERISHWCAYETYNSDPDENSDEDSDECMKQYWLPDKILYADGEWKIKSRTRIREYKDICIKMLPDGVIFTEVAKVFTVQQR